MKKLLLSIFIISNTFIMYSQTGSLSPYSFYGIGVNTFKGTMDNRSMGGLNVYSDSIHLNLTNPAAYSELKLVNFLLELIIITIISKLTTQAKQLLALT